MIAARVMPTAMLWETDNDTQEVDSGMERAKQDRLQRQPAEG
jgi:hypothetical protein